MLEKNKFLTLFIISFILSCETFKKNDQESEEKKTLEKNFALLHQRLDQLERDIKSQQAKMILLEEGVKLGITPKNKNENKPTTSNQDLETKQKTLPRETQSQKQKNSLLNKIEEGEELFKKGRYADAYFLFSEIDKQYSPSEHEEKTSYWIGRSWFQLGQWDRAKESFYRSSQLAKDSKIRASSHLYLAKTNIKLGLTTQASKNLQQILKQEPSSSPIAKAAKDLLHKIGEKL